MKYQGMLNQRVLETKLCAMTSWNISAHEVPSSVRSAFYSFIDDPVKCINKLSIKRRIYLLGASYTITLYPSMYVSHS